MKQQILDLIEYKEINIADYDSAYDLYDELDYDGSVHELVDGNIDIYNRTLREWAVDNYGYVEDAIAEGLCEGETDFHKLIQAGQYIYFRNEANEAIEEIFNEFEPEDEPEDDTEEVA